MFEQKMQNFKLQLLCENKESSDLRLGLLVQQGMIRRKNIETSIDINHLENWEVYLCGPEAMMNATTKYLKKMGVPSSHTHFEQLSF